MSSSSTCTCSTLYMHVTVELICYIYSGIAYGDPHLNTIDGFQYTFNGLGEYWLMRTEGNRFSLQGRAMQAVNINGTLTNATVFSSFVAKSVDSDDLQIDMNETMDGE